MALVLTVLRRICIALSVPEINIDTMTNINIAEFIYNNRSCIEKDEWGLVSMAINYSLGYDLCLPDNLLGYSSTPLKTNEGIPRRPGTDYTSSDRLNLSKLIKLALFGASAGRPSRYYGIWFPKLSVRLRRALLTNSFVQHIPKYYDSIISVEERMNFLKYGSVTIKTTNVNSLRGPVRAYKVIVAECILYMFSRYGVNEEFDRAVARCKESLCCKHTEEFYIVNDTTMTLICSVQFPLLEIQDDMVPYGNNNSILEIQTKYTKGLKRFYNLNTNGKLYFKDLKRIIADFSEYRICSMILHGALELGAGINLLKRPDIFLDVVLSVTRDVVIQWQVGKASLPFTAWFICMGCLNSAFVPTYCDICNEKGCKEEVCRHSNRTNKNDIYYGGRLDMITSDIVCDRPGCSYDSSNIRRFRMENMITFVPALSLYIGVCRICTDMYEVGRLSRHVDVCPRCYAVPVDEEDDCYYNTIVKTIKGLSKGTRFKTTSKIFNQRAGRFNRWANYNISSYTFYNPHSNVRLCDTHYKMHHKRTSHGFEYNESYADVECG